MYVKFILVGGVNFRPMKDYMERDVTWKHVKTVMHHYAMNIINHNESNFSISTYAMSQF